MTKTLDAIFENGVLRPVEPLEGIAEKSRVRVRVETGPAHRLAGVIGILGDEDAAEMRRVIAEEFESVDPRDWQ